MSTHYIAINNTLEQFIVREFIDDNWKTSSFEREEYDPWVDLKGFWSTEDEIRWMDEHSFDYTTGMEGYTNVTKAFKAHLNNDKKENTAMHINMNNAVLVNATRQILAMDDSFVEFCRDEWEAINLGQILWGPTDELLVIGLENAHEMVGTGNKIEEYLNYPSVSRIGFSVFSSLFRHDGGLCIVCMEQGEAHIPALLNDQMAGYAHFECFEEQNRTKPGSAVMDIKTIATNNNIVLTDDWGNPINEIKEEKDMNECEHFEEKERCAAPTPGTLCDEHAPTTQKESVKTWPVVLTIEDARTLWHLFNNNGKAASAQRLTVAVRNLIEFMVARGHSPADTTKFKMNVREETILFVIKHTDDSRFIRLFTKPVEDAGDDIAIPCYCPKHDSNVKNMGSEFNTNWVRFACLHCGDKPTGISKFWKDRSFHSRYERVNAN